MRSPLPLLLVVLGACTSPDMGKPGGKARFETYPGELFAAFETACESPAQMFVRPTPRQVECREFLPPEETAAIILGFDGTPTDLPQLVIRFTALPVRQGFEVQNDVFLNVPQKTGPPLEVRQHETQFQHSLAKLYQRFGGAPL